MRYIHRPVGGGGNTVSTLLLSTGLPDSLFPRFTFLAPPPPVFIVRGLFGGKAGGPPSPDAHTGRQVRGEGGIPLAPALTGLTTSAGE